ncbi:ABC transporter substrate-binding protein [Algoriphagus terrigena]|uniref:ABC transporter substrate-binding protein n=1 Tax=Algoriphagus terrigena TaxID=344884 RepID=UPI00047DB687|nr:ABC transporter substrate-binding protein [Algoriphagus terrigena]
MKTLRITGVPEHFNYPFRLVEQEQPFADRGVKIQWIEESRGSGQMNIALRNDETDIALLLTESFLKDFEAGNPSKMIGFHVDSPLIWGIHVGTNTPANTLSDVDKKSFLVSRMGSGSHLMALVLAQKEGWKKEDLTYDVIGNMDGAKLAMDHGNEGMFLWEKYMTAPMVKNGTMKRIGEVPSPWPCFVMVASDKALAELGPLIFELRDYIYKTSEFLMKDPNRVQTLASAYHLAERDVEKWLEQTRWTTEAKVPRSELERAIKTMQGLGILNKELPLEDFLADGDLRVLD